MPRLLECVPNFSEGRNRAVIDSIARAMGEVDQVKVLGVDPGASTNRTVITIAGEPEAVIEAAFRGIKTAAELIDMRKHTGEHPRMGATDVCPLIPIEGISEDEAVELANQLAQRVGEELGIPVYLYEAAAKSPERESLAEIRSGEYEGFAEKIYSPQWAPDYGPQEYNAKAGQTVIGVRKFLVAYNINLNTQSVKRANSVAFDIREKGRVKRVGNPITGEIVRDEAGNPVREPGMLKKVRAIGWFIEEYGFAQVSINLTDLDVSPLHKVFEAAEKSCYNRGLRITGSELVGLIPKKALVEAGKYFLERQNRSQGVDETTLIQVAVKSLGLDELGPFNPEERVIEYALKQDEPAALTALSARDFANEVARESPAPGGGSVAALVGSLGVALGAMVANLSANKRGWEERIPEFSRLAVDLQAIKDRLLELVDADTDAYNAVMAAYRMPKSTEAEQTTRNKAIEAANQHAARVPLQIMETVNSAFPLMKSIVEEGNPNSITDGAVGTLALHAALHGAALNVRINLDGIETEEVKKELSTNVEELTQRADEQKSDILSYVNFQMNAG